MSHYKDTTPAALGHFVKWREGNSNRLTFGTIVEIHPGATTCNASIAVAVQVFLHPDGTPITTIKPSFDRTTVTLGECERVA